MCVALLFGGQYYYIQEWKRTLEELATVRAEMDVHRAEVEKMKRVEGAV